MSGSTKSDVLVIGAGVVGMACARDLARRGMSVTIIDQGRIGHGCSYGNAGWITPCFALPLPRPGMLFKSLHWLLDPSSPLHIQPRLSAELVRWLLRFTRSMNAAHLERSTRALVALSVRSLEEYRRLQQEDATIQLETTGLLMVGQTAAGVEASDLERELVKQYGIRGERLTADQVRRQEPALTGRIEGAVYFPDEAHAEPLAVVQAMARSAERAGARWVENTEFYDFRFSKSARGLKRIESVVTTRGEFRADQVVLAAGTWSNRLGRRLGLRIPVLGGKGYALIVPPLERQPRTAIMLVEKKIAITPRTDSLRLAGTLELVKDDATLNPRRVRAILDGTREFLDLPVEPQILELWRGLRPCLPDGVPLIDRAPSYENLIVATGHQMLGLQSAPGTGHWVGELVSRQSSIREISADLAVFGWR